MPGNERSIDEPGSIGPSEPGSIGLDEPGSIGPGAERLELRGVVQRFKRGREEVALRFPDFVLAQGEHAVLTGPSGSGKTTLLHLVAGLLVATQGVVRVAGHNLAELSEAQRDALRARRVGYVFQDFHLLEGYSALENVVLALGLAGLPRRERRSRAEEALRALDLGGRLSHPPKRLSTGERQRVALARAVAPRPLLLLADEPTAHLDRARADLALTLLQESARRLGATLLVATHDPRVMAAFKTRVEVAA